MPDQFAIVSERQKLKKTPVGLIPVDWDVVSFGEAFQFLSTANNSRADLKEVGDFGYIHYGDIHTKWRTTLRCDRVSLPQIDKGVVGRAVAKVRDGDLVMADASEDYDALGVAAEVQGVGSKEIVSGLHTLLLRDKGGYFADGFRGYLQYMPSVRRQLMEAATGVSVFGISKTNLSRVLVPRPPLDEQRQIAEILVTLNEASIASSMVASKSDELKRGVMVSLTKERSWEEKSLREVSEVITKGTTPTTVGFSFQDHGVAFIKVENIAAGGRIRRSDVAHISEDAHQALARSILKAGDVLFSIAGALGRCALVSEDILPANTNQALAIIRPKRDIVVPRFLYYYLQSSRIRNHIEQLGTKGAQVNLSLSQVSDLSLSLPSVKRQKEIVDVLSAVEDELETLRVARMQDEKLNLGLARGLLSGRIRMRASS